MTLREKICDYCGQIHSELFDGICPKEFEDYKKKRKRRNRMVKKNG